MLEAIGEEERYTAGRQHLDDLVDHALRHGQRPVPDVDGQQQLGDRIDCRPHPVRGTREPRDGLSLADLADLHGAEQGKEFVELHLRDPHVVQEVLGKDLEMVRSFDQPVQHRIGVHLEDAGDGTDAEPFRQRAHGPHQQIRRDTLAMEQRAVGLQNVPVTGGAVPLAPGAAAGMPCTIREERRVQLSVA